MTTEEQGDEGVVRIPLTRGRIIKEIQVLFTACPRIAADVVIC